ncbi:MAG: LL-diaminopimelate aminotransferase [Actinobacteria bacterium]|nr:LL-diaminopimelate aminotransferase [Actinomycetota bacterium]
MQQANRIANLPPYLFAEIDKKIAKKKADGVDVISLGIGDPDQPTPDHILKRMCKEVRNPKNHQYPSYYGLPEFRKSIAEWYYKRFKIELNHDTEVLPLIGSKEGIAHILLALVDPGDVSLVPDPGYPAYNTGTILAGGIPHFIPLLRENNFLVDFDKIDEETAKKSKIVFINYPNNPTAAIADINFYNKAVEFAKKHNIVICHDFAYSEITYDGYTAPSFLETEGAREVGVEFHSLSKTYNMTGWRIGFVVGNADVIEALGRVKTNIDSGIFNAIQYAGVEALTSSQECVSKMCEIYKRRRDLVVETLNALGWNVSKPKGSIYIWASVPSGYTSASFATHVLEKAGVVVSPGNAYGSSGEGYFRISLTINDERLKEALDRIRKIL